MKEISKGQFIEEHHVQWGMFPCQIARLDYQGMDQPWYTMINPIFAEYKFFLLIKID